MPSANSRAERDVGAVRAERANRTGCSTDAVVAVWRFLLRFPSALTPHSSGVGVGSGILDASFDHAP